MVTFGLVHGAYHGSWCWERLTPELERQGHRVLTVDLPSEDPQAGAAEYAAAALTAFGGAGDDLVVVGHSLGGLTIPLIAAARPVRRLIFVAGMLPRPGKSQEEVVSAEPDMVLPGPERGAYRGPGGETRWRPEAAAHWFFADCTADEAAWAASRLRGQCWKITREVTPLSAWPAVPWRQPRGRRGVVGQDHGSSQATGDRSGQARTVQPAAGQRTGQPGGQPGAAAHVMVPVHGRAPDDDHRLR